MGAALVKAEKIGEVEPATIAAIRLLLLTGCRRSEVLSLRWEWIDRKARTIRLPDSKTGAKTIHLGEAALKVLTGLTQTSPFVFPTTEDKKSPMVGHTLDNGWRRVRKLAKLDGYRLHDLRHTYASWAVMGGQSLPITGALLGHTEMQTTQRYAHLSDDPLRLAADDISGRLAGALKGARQ